MIEENIDCFEFLLENQKKLLNDKEYLKYFDSYKRKHKYFTLSRITSDFISDVLNLNPNNYKKSKENLGMLKKGLRFKFSHLIRKDLLVKRYNTSSYVVLEGRSDKKREIFCNTKEDFNRKVSKSISSNKDVMIKYDGKAFLLNSTRKKILYYLQDEDLTSHELSNAIEKTMATVNKHVKYLKSFGLVKSYNVAREFRKGRPEVFWKSKLNEKITLNEKMLK